MAEQFAIASRLYAEAAARVGTSGRPLPDHAQLIAPADAEEALHRSQGAFAVLKEHISSHHRFTAAKLSVFEHGPQVHDGRRRDAATAL